MTLLSEIREQPGVFRRMLSDGRPGIEAIGRATRDRFQYVVIAARGTSDNAARYAKYLWATQNRLEVSLAAPSLFSTYSAPPNLDGALVVGISQSGESPDLIAVLEEARRQGRPTVAITNAPRSPLANLGDWVLDIDAGDERAVAATKSYTSQLLGIALLSAAWGGASDDAAFAALPTMAEAVLETEELARDAAAEFATAEACAVLGRGYNRATSFEWALKLQETSYVLAQPFSTADFRHGPIAVVEAGFPILAVAPHGAVSAEIVELVGELRADRNARAAMITNTASGDAADFVLPIPSCPEWISPLVAIVSGQLFAYHLALARGADPDSPRGLSKVTKTL